MSSVVPLVPSYYEKYTHFTTEIPADDILIRLQEIFVDNDQIDMKESSSYSLTCTLYEDYLNVEFDVNIFQADSKSFIVEFQKASGDVSLFNNIYRTTKARFLGIDIGRPNFNNKSSDYVQIDEETIKLLLKMVKSEYVDESYGGLKIIASAACHADNHEILAKNIIPLMPILNLDANRAQCVAFILLKLSKIKQIFSDYMMESIVQVLATSKFSEVKRILIQTIMIIDPRNVDYSVIVDLLEDD